MSFALSKDLIICSKGLWNSLNMNSILHMNLQFEHLCVCVCVCVCVCAANSAHTICALHVCMQLCVLLYLFEFDISTIKVCLKYHYCQHADAYD